MKHFKKDKTFLQQRTIVSIPTSALVVKANNCDKTDGMLGGHAFVQMFGG